jgi:hypothetical protein
MEELVFESDVQRGARELVGGWQAAVLRAKHRAGDVWQSRHRVIALFADVVQRADVRVV